MRQKCKHPDRNSSLALASRARNTRNRKRFNGIPLTEAR